MPKLQAGEVILEESWGAELLRAKANTCCAGIDRCYVVEKKKDEPGPDFRVQTDGISFEGACMNDDLVDVNQVTCNDVGAVLRTFGVEAARRTVVAEVGGVFGAYGIGVDPRHLSLISDHMTRQVRPWLLLHSSRDTRASCVNVGGGLTLFIPLSGILVRCIDMCRSSMPENDNCAIFTAGLYTT